MVQTMAEESYVLPTSFAQQRLWFLDQLDPGAATYNMPGAIRLTGPLNVAALQKSLDEILNRHESLRTTFAVVDGTPVQVISPTLHIGLSTVELRHLSVLQREEMVKGMAIEEAQQAFNLATGPLLRVKLLCLAENEFMLLITMHHVISDEWSIGVFVHELTTFYDAFATNRLASLPELSIQYADFALWQQEWLQTGGLDEQLGYWKQQLGGSPPALELPSDNPRPSVQTFRGAHRAFALPAGLSESLTRLSRQEGVTLFMLLLAAYQTLLHRYTGQDDITVGSPIANRNRREIEPLIGFFVNTLVLRTDLSGDPTFREVLGRVREVALGAYDHQDVPFEKLVEALQPERDTSRSPLFQVAFQLQAADSLALRLGDLELEIMTVESGTSKFDMTFQLTEKPEGLSGQVEYNTDLFDESTINRMALHFRTLLESVAVNPGQPISQLPILTQAERHQLLVEWNDTQIDNFSAGALNQSFEDQVKRTPSATALVFDGQRLTYEQLNQQSNKLAHYLQSLGVVPETKVGICVEPSADLVVTLLALLKAGAAYVPFNPANPKERLAFMFDDSKISVLLTQERFLGLLPEHKAHVICMDTDRQVISQQPDHNPANAATLDNLIAVLYTSGSTGKPKGVMVTSRGFVNLCQWYKRHCPITEQSRVLLVIPFTFDAAFKNMITPLIAGGRLVLTSADYYDVARLHEIIEKEEVTVINTTPSLIHPIMELAAGKDYRGLSSLKYMGLGGESMDIQKLKPWLNSPYCECKLVHLYGPSECSDISACYLVGKGQVDSLQAVPIGKPIDNAQVYILDKYNNPQPAGVPGEVSVSGPTTARGYFNAAALTSQSFTPNLYGVCGERIYRTGDLAKWLPDGNLEFVGRIDNQVKIRGIRIELGEIEAVLRQHPQMREAVIVALPDAAGDKRLVAYVVADQQTSAKQLRNFMKLKLPAYMVPSSFVILEALPLTANGKLDRRALPPPDDASLDLESNYVAPRNATEETMARLWTDLLKIERISIHDSFFELGGHSLLATQLISRVREAFEVDLPLRSLFEVATIAGLAEAVENSKNSAGEFSGPVIKRASRESYRAKIPS